MNFDEAKTSFESARSRQFRFNGYSLFTQSPLPPLPSGLSVASEEVYISSAEMALDDMALDERVAIEVLGLEVINTHTIVESSMAVLAPWFEEMEADAPGVYYIDKAHDICIHRDGEYRDGLPFASGWGGYQRLTEFLMEARHQCWANQTDIGEEGWEWTIRISPPPFRHRYSAGANVAQGDVDSIGVTAARLALVYVRHLRMVGVGWDTEATRKKQPVDWQGLSDEVADMLTGFDPGEELTYSNVPANPPAIMTLADAKAAWEKYIKGGGNGSTEG